MAHHTGRLQRARPYLVVILLLLQLSGTAVARMLAHGGSVLQTSSACGHLQMSIAATDADELPTEADIEELPAAAPTRADRMLPRLQNEGRAEPSFADPSKRIARTLGDMALPTRVELLRSRLPPGYAPPKPPYDSVNTQHTLEVVVGALLALTDGKLSDMQDAADPLGVERINEAMDAARALGNKPPRKERGGMNS